MKNIRWIDLNIKEKLAIATALIAFTIGWGLSIAAFIVPPVGVISDGVLWILGQSLVYAASVFGITGYFSAETVKMKADMNRHFEHMERMQIEREKIRKGLDKGEAPYENDDIVEDE